MMNSAFLWTWLVSLAAAKPVPGPGFMRTVYLEYEDGTPQGHFNFGQALGQAVGSVVADAWAGDRELAEMESWTQSLAGQRIFRALVDESNRSFPLYTREVEGFASGAGLPLTRVLVNQLREELAQWTRTASGRPRLGHCTDAYVANPAEGVVALGHNDDWDVDWRRHTYVIVATALDTLGREKFRFGTWVYPGYLPGEQLNWNSHGLVWTCNSLFPRKFADSGVGTAWVGRHMLEASTFDDLVSRASDSRVSTALNYNIGTLHERALWNLEVDTAGVYAISRINGSYVHTNQFKLLSSPQFPEASSDHREARWKELVPRSVPGILDFLSDRADPAWPVWRNATGGDSCYTQATGLFDFERRTLSIWTGPPNASAPELEIGLDFAQREILF